MALASGSQALVPNLLNKSNALVSSNALSELLSLVVGVALISGLAQIAIPLPWTPVPITGQTLGVSLVALSWGRHRAVLIMLAYLLLGSVGLPIFAMGKSGFLMGPTMGYLMGMVLATYVAGALSDFGFTKGFWKSLMAAYCGSICVLGMGLLVLSFYVPSEQLLMAGLWPFLPGDLIKNTVAALTSWRLRQSLV